MASIPIQRLTSSTSNVVAAGSKAAAVTALLGGAAPNSVNVGNAPLIWPQLAKFDNDNTTFAGAANPQFLWSKPVPIPGEIQGFAASSVTIPLSVGVLNSFVIALTVFADNAVTANIQAIDALGLTIVPFTNLNVDLMAGSLNPLSGISPDNKNPYNWQNVRFYSVPATSGLISVALDVKFIFSFEVANYVNNGAINTAGLAFAADIYQSTLL
ncbi:hypothetical protein BVG16_05390 [Paenibacillus selenitireducens]|uniref:Uncharacterized protein n=1 Tax=Paenibacillus selenitireducens TaxID=1324314 RepID=A0A1T2XJY7_9BACL|nr:hypothetical protein [Paenibacillus selenitireducens]OPA80180.1 hypothetical protein BVG16_05390 [Paenibacillus selenitireducens]